MQLARHVYQTHTECAGCCESSPGANDMFVFGEEQVKRLIKQGEFVQPRTSKEFENGISAVAVRCLIPQRSYRRAWHGK